MCFPFSVLLINQVFGSTFIYKDKTTLPLKAGFVAVILFNVEITSPTSIFLRLSKNVFIMSLFAIGKSDGAAFGVNGARGVVNLVCANGAPLFTWGAEKTGF